MVVRGVNWPFSRFGVVDFATSTHGLLDQEGEADAYGFADEDTVDFVGEVQDVVVDIFDVVFLCALRDKKLDFDVYRLHERRDESLVERGDCFKGAFVLVDVLG